MAVQRELFSTIKKWIKSYRTSKFHIRETNSVVIDLDKIRTFISHIDQINSDRATRKQINGVRFYFVRQNDYFVNHPNDNTDGNNTREIVFKDNNGIDQTQISLLALPVINYRVQSRAFVGEDEGIAEAIKALKFEDRDIMVDCLYAASTRSEHTGLCPYNCAGTIDENA
jgi:uncharacterized UPF0160 family protein